MSLSERIATLVLSTFDSIPQRCKPRTQPNNQQEWTPMAAIVLTTGGPDNTELRCVSLATGTKCLPASTISKCAGLVVHDSHAEILCLRGLNRWLLNEIKHLLYDSAYVSLAVASRPCSTDLTWGAPPFAIREDVRVYMFCTVAPCGDASMELLMAKTGNAVPWEVDPAMSMPLGRGYFSILGAVRRKPARADAEATMSMSCSDKLALSQFVGVLGFPLSLLVGGGNCFLKGLVVYEDQFDEVGYERAFGQNGRLQCITEVDGKFFDVHVLPKTFPRFRYERTVYADGKSAKVTNVCAVYVAASDVKGSVPVCEVLVNGVKQGYKQFDDRVMKGSVLCRKKMAESAVEAYKLLEERGFRVLNIEGMNYSTMKLLESHHRRRDVRSRIVKALGGWISNSMEDDFQL